MVGLGGLVSFWVVWVVFGWFGWFLAGLGGFWLVWLDSYFRNNVLLCSFISKIIFKTVLLISHFHCVSYTIAHCDTFQMRKYYQLTCHTLYCFSQNS